ncbi:MAG: type III polyketide synthase [Bdellovibrionaceae bacterium]|nr:type III polyketide synthase [Pseudobdellovibrionaceae bacterium]
MPASVFLNRIQTAVPAYEAHAKFMEFVPATLTDERERKLFLRLAAKSHIERRYSVCQASSDQDVLDAEGIYRRGRFPGTAERMRLYRKTALPLAARALRPLFDEWPADRFTHLIVTSCTGFYAPGLDLEILREFRLAPTVERSVIGFMGCYAALNGLKAAWHIVRSQPGARVLMVNLEICTLHMQEHFDLEQLLAFMQFADGCAASVISAEPGGLELHEFHCQTIHEARELIEWRVGDDGFDMHLSPKVPQALAGNVPPLLDDWLQERRRDITLWAVHPGGRAILDVIQDQLRLSQAQMEASRAVLREYGNMSSATIMFVLERLMRTAEPRGSGVAMAFGPGLTMEALLFAKHG